MNVTDIVLGAVVGVVLGALIHRIDTLSDRLRDNQEAVKGFGGKLDEILRDNESRKTIDALRGPQKWGFQHEQEYIPYKPHGPLGPWVTTGVVSTTDGSNMEAYSG